MFQKMLTYFGKCVILYLIYLVGICPTVLNLRGELQMKCPECGKDINDNDVFCGNCGAEIIYNTIGAVDGENKEATEDEPKSAQKKKPSKKKTEKDGKRKKLVLAVRITGIIALAAVITAVVLCIVVSVKASAGRKIFDSVPLGRNIDIIEAETGTAFIGGESSLYGALNYISDYDYICESEKNVNVGGVELPEWAVVLKKNDSGDIGEAVLYNFYVIKHNWMGNKTTDNIEKTVIKYGDTLKKAENALGLKAYTIIKESAENTSTYVYRYHYTDSETGNTVVKNFYIVISDVDGQVKDVRDEQVDYLKMILQAE